MGAVRGSQKACLLRAYISRWAGELLGRCRRQHRLCGCSLWCSTSEGDLSSMPGSLKIHIFSLLSFPGTAVDKLKQFVCSVSSSQKAELA